MSLTHAQLVDAARSWLRNQQRCVVVITEMVTGAMETPDAIGWFSGGGTIVIECKASRRDFLADARKHFRRKPEYGMGDQRYYMAPAGLLRAEEMPRGWGLVEVGAKVRIIRKSTGECTTDCVAPALCFHKPFEVKAHNREAQVLLSLIRRLKGPGVLGRATADVRAYELDQHGQKVSEDA